MKRFQSFQISQFRSFTFSKFQVLKASEFQCFKAPKLQYHKVSKIQRIHFMFLINIDPILLKFHFMFSGRYQSHVQYFQELNKRIFGILRPPPFPTFSKCVMSNILRFPRRVIPKRSLHFLDFLKYLGIPSFKNN